MAIRDWHAHDRPREKLLTFGADSLSDAELLAIFLRVGVKGKSAVELAQDLLDHFGSLDQLLQADEHDFCQAKGLGQAKYVQLKAVLAMADRHFQSGLKRGQAMTHPETVAAFLHLQLRPKHRESFGVLYLDQQHRLIQFEVLFTGTLNQTQVYTREILKSVLDHEAAAVILAHNHPSGHCEPSEADRIITQRIEAALALIDVRCLDHVILGDQGRWFSFREQGLLTP